MEYYAGLKNICLKRISLQKKCVQQDCCFLGEKMFIHIGKRLP